MTEACNKGAVRCLLKGSSVGLSYYIDAPGCLLGGSPAFLARRYVVKPAFGMSSTDVRFFDSWEAVSAHIEIATATEWVPRDVMMGLGLVDDRSDLWIVEPFIEGTEFSIDGWIRDEAFHAIVQHKLSMVQTETFIGDGPTVTPPLKSSGLCGSWNGLENDEESICAFGRIVLDAIGLSSGVFHIEGREDPTTGKLTLVEVNPRAPGGSLWKSAYLRTGFDLELVDAALQLGLVIPAADEPRSNHVVHYPYYAPHRGVLVDWGDLPRIGELVSTTASVDYAATLGSEFTKADLDGEPYLAFAVAYEATAGKLLETVDRLISIMPPTVEA